MRFLLLLAFSDPSAMADEAIKEQILQKAVVELRTTLKDAQSARFMAVHFRSTIGIDKQKYWSICGKINSKNSYGAYTGFQTFMASQVEGRFHLTMGGGRDEWFARAACDPTRGTWLMDSDLSNRFTTLVTALN